MKPKFEIEDTVWIKKSVSVTRLSRVLFGNVSAATGGPLSKDEREAFRATAGEVKDSKGTVVGYRHNNEVAEVIMLGEDLPYLIPVNLLETTHLNPRRRKA